MRQNCLTAYTGDYYCADSCELGPCEDDEECTLSYDASCTMSSSNQCPPVANCTALVNEGDDDHYGQVRRGGCTRVMHGRRRMIIDPRHANPNQTKPNPTSHQKRFLVGCSSPFMRLAQHLTALRAWC